MTAMPLVRVQKPSDLGSELNGAVSPSKLAAVKNAPAGGVMHHLVALQMAALHFAALIEAGIRFTSTGRGRTYTQQVTVLVQRYKPCTYAVYLLTAPLGRARKWPDDSRKPAIYRGKVYWTKIQNSNGSYPAQVAVPGTSNHGWWCSDDMAELTSTGTLIPLSAKAIEWLNANGLRFGITGETTKEPWHRSTCVGDLLPKEVTRYIACQNAPTIQEGSTGDYVFWAQSLMGVVADGRFGSRTKAAVVWCQGVWGQPQTGIIDTKFWWMLGKDK